jgi:predicted nucleotidyltransferase
VSEIIHLASDTPAGMVIAGLHERIDPLQPPMLIGAEARDILHARLGHSFATRATHDVDLAFVISSWESYATLTQGLTPIRDSGIAFRVAGMHVDVMAFGPVESPAGTLTPPFRSKDPLDVFGMSQVYEAAQAVLVENGPEIRLPTVAGYVALKLKAWIDRSAVHNEKDAPDVGLALFWASESQRYNDQFWGDVEFVGRWNADPGLGGAAILGAEVREVLGPAASDHVAELFTGASREQLSRLLRSSPRELLLGDHDRRMAALAALTAGLHGEVRVNAPAID